MYSEIKLKEKRVVIYYSANYKTMRYATGVTIKDKSDWNSRKMELTTTVDDYESKMKIINQWKQRADEIINKSLEEGYKISGNELERELNKFKLGIAISKSSDLKDLFDQFYNEKSEELLNNPKKSPASLKDYTSFKNTLIDFEDEHDSQLSISLIDKTWCKKFERWLAKNRPSGSKTRGGLNEKTIKKRFDTLKGCLRWLEENNVIKNVSAVLNYRISVPDTFIDTLSIDETRKFYQTKFEKQKHQNVRDLFIFACHTGVRWEDLCRVQKLHIKQYEDGLLLTKITHKSRNTTQDRFSVPLSKTALEIFKRHNYNLKLMSNVKANLYIKEAMLISDLFNDKIEKRNKDGKYMKRHEYFSFHDGRRTFITNLVNSAIPVNEIMKYTGHKKISTLQQYIDKSRPTKFEFIKVLD